MGNPTEANRGYTEGGAWTKPPRKTEAHLAPYLLGTFLVDKNLSIAGNGPISRPATSLTIRTHIAALRLGVMF